MLFKSNKQTKKKTRHGNSTLSQRKIQNILRTLPHDAAFHFYEEVGRPTGQVATSLLEFRDKIVDPHTPQTRTSLVFHAKRGDFTNWVRDTLGDPELASRISKINPEDALLEKKLYNAVSERIQQLRETLHTYTIVPEDEAVILDNPWNPQTIKR